MSDSGTSFTLPTIGPEQLAGAACVPPQTHETTTTVGDDTACLRETLRRLTAIDASFIYLERPSQPMHVASIVMFDGSLELPRLLADLDARIRLVPRYLQRLVPAPLGLAHPTWEPDPDFNLRAHVSHRWLQPPGGDRELGTLCGTLYAQPLEQLRPLWEIHVIDGYCGGDPPGKGRSPRGRRGSRCGQEGDRAHTVLFIKVHHCMIDGVSGVQLLGALLDVVPNPPPSTTPRVGFPQALPGTAKRLRDAIVHRAAARIAHGRTMVTLLTRPRSTLEALREGASAIVDAGWSCLSAAPLTPLNGRIGAARALAWVTLSLRMARSIKSRLGGTINDLVLAITAGGLRRILREHGTDPDRLELRAIVPVNLRTSGEYLDLGNRISFMVAPLPVGVHDPIERLRQVAVATAQLKAANEPARMARLLGLADLLPPVVVRSVGWIPQPARPINTICTNVPGPSIALYQQGVRVSGLAPFAPLIDGIGVAFAVISYEDALTIGVTVDPDFGIDADLVAASLRASFTELRDASGVASQRVHEVRAAS
jgi:WS/DGAT/MGAT family acyltransferase